MKMPSRLKKLDLSKLSKSLKSIKRPKGFKAPGGLKGPALFKKPLFRKSGPFRKSGLFKQEGLLKKLEPLKKLGRFKLPKLSRKSKKPGASKKGAPFNWRRTAKRRPRPAKKFKPIEWPNPREWLKPSNWSRPRMPFSFTRMIYLLTTLLVFAAAVHISIILLMPYLSLGNAYSRLEPIASINKLSILTAGEKHVEPLPFMAPDILYAACRYDISEGPLELRTPIPNDLWSIAVYNRLGENYYLMSGRDVQSRTVNMLLVEQKTIDPEKQQQQDKSAAGNKELREVTVSALSKTGVIIVRAPVPNPAYYEEVTQLLKTAFCRPVSFAQHANASNSAPR